MLAAAPNERKEEARNSEKSVVEKELNVNLIVSL